MALAACQPAAAPAVDVAAEEAAIRDQSAKWLEVAKTKNPTAELAFITSDAVFYRAHVEPLVGHAAIEAHFKKDLAENPQAAVSWSTDAVLVSASGDLAVETGTFNVTGLGPKGDVTDKGKFVTVWKKVDGQWKAVRDIGATTMPENPAHH